MENLGHALKKSIVSRTLLGDTSEQKGSAYAHGTHLL